MEQCPALSVQGNFIGGSMKSYKKVIRPYFELSVFKKIQLWFMRLFKIRVKISLKRRSLYRWMILSVMLQEKYLHLYYNFDQNTLMVPFIPLYGRNSIDIKTRDDFGLTLYGKKLGGFSNHFKVNDVT